MPASSSSACAQNAVDELGIELGAPPRAEHLDGGVDAADPMQRLDVVGDVDDPHDTGDLVARQVAGRALAVPALERLLQRVAHLRAEPEPQRQVARGLAVRGHRPLDLLRAAREEPADHREPPDRGAPAGDVADHEAHHRQPGHVDQVAVGPHRRVVAEPLAHLVRVGHAADPRQQRHVEDRRPARRRTSRRRSASRMRDDRLADDVLLRLTQPQIGRQRQRRHQLSQTNAVSRARHLPSVRRICCCGSLSLKMSVLHPERRAMIGTSRARRVRQRAVTVSRPCPAGCDRWLGGRTRRRSAEINVGSVDVYVISAPPAGVVAWTTLTRAAPCCKSLTRHVHAVDLGGIGVVALTEVLGFCLQVRADRFADPRVSVASLTTTFSTPPCAVCVKVCVVRFRSNGMTCWARAAIAVRRSGDGRRRVPGATNHDDEHRQGDDPPPAAHRVGIAPKARVTGDATSCVKSSHREVASGLVDGRRCGAGTVGLVHADGDDKPDSAGERRDGPDRGR